MIPLVRGLQSTQQLINKKICIFNITAKSQNLTCSNKLPQWRKKRKTIKIVRNDRGITNEKNTCVRNDVRGEKDGRRTTKL